MKPIRPAVLRAAEELDLHARRNITSLLAGSYATPHKGSGMQFKEFRHYEPGDDIRHMSWAVTARTGKATIKLYEEERELDVLILVDTSGSSLFGTKQTRKIDMYHDLLALLGLAAIKAGDNSGLLLFDAKPGTYLPPRRAREQVMISLMELERQNLRGKPSDLRTALQFARAVLKNRTLIFVISDFLFPPFLEEMRMLTRRHEIVLLHCFDEIEEGKLEKGVYEACDPETGKFFLLDGNSAATRLALLEHQKDLRSQLRSSSRNCGGDYLPLNIHEDYLQHVVRYFDLRGLRRG